MSAFPDRSAVVPSVGERLARVQQCVTLVHAALAGQDDTGDGVIESSLAALQDARLELEALTTMLPEVIVEAPAPDLN